MKAFAVSFHLKLLVLLIQVDTLVRHESTAINAERGCDAPRPRPVIPLIALASQHTQYLRPEHEDDGRRRRELRPHKAQQVLDVGTSLRKYK